MTETPEHRRVLLVEDDDQDAFLFEKMLREDVGAAEIERMVEGRQAFESLKAGPAPDCVVLDLRLAGEDGLWLLDRMLEDETLARIPVIVFSGDADRLQRACASFPNVVSSVKKPETLDQYRAALTIVAAILAAAVDGR
ncbi:MAG: response regulator [Oceanicaulis sp.]